MRKLNGSMDMFGNTKEKQKQKKKKKRKSIEMSERRAYEFSLFSKPKHTLKSKV